MKLSEFPPDRAADLLTSIFRRYRDARERWPPYIGIRTEVYLSVDEARLIYASGQYLLRYDGWVREAEKAKGKVGVWPAEFDLSFCARWMSEKAEKIDKNDPKLILTVRDMKIICSSVSHLDHYHLLMSAKDRPRQGNWKKR